MLAFEKSLIPKFFRIRQSFDAEELTDIEKAVSEGMAGCMERIKAGGRIGVAAGSRGIYQYARIVKAVIDQVRAAGADPVIIPAMGSHGEGTPEGQAALLDSYNITEETMGVPLMASMETVILGYTPDGMPVHFGKDALGLDGIILVNRVKPHTDFHGPIESGVVKQTVVGLGKHNGALAVHRRGVYGLKNNIPEAAAIIIDKAPILMGVAILENAFDHTSRIEVIPAEDMIEREQALLPEAKSLMPSLPFKKLDVLVLQEMGKNISGTGMDPNIVGRYLIRNVPDRDPDIYRIVCLDLRAECHGNAMGVGIADVITKRLYDKIDFGPTYVNAVTAGFLERVFVPLVAENDREALEIALNSCNRFVTEADARVVFARNTLEIADLLVSEALLPEIENRKDIEIIGKIELEWQSDGALRSHFVN